MFFMLDSTELKNLFNQKERKFYAQLGMKMIMLINVTSVGLSHFQCHNHAGLISTPTIPMKETSLTV